MRELWKKETSNLLALYVFFLCHLNAILPWCLRNFLLCHTYSLDDTPHFCDPVNIVNECMVFHKNLLESLSSYTNLGKSKDVRQVIYQI